MSILIMISSTVVVSIIVRKQSEQTAHDQIQKALNIVQNDLSDKEEKILKDARQMATVDDLGSSLKFLMDYKSNDQATLTGSTYKTISNNIYQIGMTGGIWKTFVYDLNGDLVSFSVQKDRDSVLMGHTVSGTESSFEYAVLKQGEKIQADSWQKTNQPPDESIEVRFKNQMPKDEKLFFQESGNNLCLVALIPAIGTDYEEGTGNAVYRQFGFVKTFLKIDRGFAAKMSRLTGMRINIFLNDTLVIGDIQEYNRLDSDIIKAGGPNVRTLTNGMVLNSVDIAEEGYFQGILPLHDESGVIGAITTLLSRHIVSKKYLADYTDFDFGFYRSSPIGYSLSHFFSLTPLPDLSTVLLIT